MKTKNIQSGDLGESGKESGNLGIGFSKVKGNPMPNRSQTFSKIRSYFMFFEIIFTFSCLLRSPRLSLRGPLRSPPR